MFRFLLAVWLVLLLCGTALAQVPYIVEIDLASKSVQVTNRIAIRETVPVRLVNTGIHAASNLVLRLSATTQTMAMASGFVPDSPGVAVGSLDLNTQEFVDFFEGAAPQTRRVFTLAVWDVGLNRLLVNAQVQVMNNPYQDGMPGPSPIGLYYLPGHFTGTNWVPGGIYQATETPGVFRLALPDSLVATVTSLPWGVISGDLNLQTDLIARLTFLAAHATDEVARADASNALALASAALTNLPAGVVTTGDVGVVTYPMLDPALLAILSTGAVWGGISGDLNLQTDLIARLNQMAADWDAAVGLVETNLTAQHTGDIARIDGDIDALNQQMGSLVLSGGVSVVTYGGFYADEWAREILFSAVPRSSPSSNALVNPHVDAAAMRFWSDVTAIDYWASLLESRNNTNAPVVWSVGNPALASVDTNGFITSLLPGTTTVAAAVGGVSVSTGIALHVATHGIMDWQVSGPIGYWRRLVYTSLVDRITNEASSLVMSAFDHATTNYQWRTNGPMAGVDLSAAPIWNSRWNSKHNNGILIAPKILLTAEHSLITPGTRFRFLTPNNELVERTTVRAAAVPWTGGGYTDAQLHELDEAITNIQPVRLLGSGWWNYVSAISLEGSGMRVYEYTNIVYGADIAPYLPIFDFDKVGRIVTWTMGNSAPLRPNEPWLNKFWRNLTGGDSGAPLFVLAGNEPVLLGVVMMNSGKPGAWVWDIKQTMNQTLSEMCPTCDTIQWYEGFTNYIPTAPIP